MSRSDQHREACSRCGRDVPVTDAAMLVQRHNKGLWRVMCPDCLKETGVPEGYRLERDITHLYGGTAPDGEEAADSQTESSVVADFQARVVTSEMPGDTLRSGRILMNERQLVVATDDERTVIPLAAITDVGTGQGSDHTREFFDDVVRLTYERDGREARAFVGGPRESLDRFTLVLFSSLLSGTRVSVRHPTNVGGRPVTPPVRTGILSIESNGIRVLGTEATVGVKHESVVQFERADPDWSGGSPTLRVFRNTKGRVVVSEFALPADRFLTLLGRFLQLEFGETHAAIESVELSVDHVHYLGALYALGPDSDRESVLPVPDREAFLEPLLTHGLISRGDADRPQGAPEGDEPADPTDARPILQQAGLIALFSRFEAVE